jgi:hypothetical protein
VFRSAFTIEVPPTAMIFEFQEFIYTGLRSNGFIGGNFQFRLDILPLPKTPTQEDLLKENIADLHDSAQQPKDLPTIAASNFFTQQVMNGVHFLVWLPPLGREFLWLTRNLSNI